MIKNGFSQNNVETYFTINKMNEITLNSEYFITFGKVTFIYNFIRNSLF